MKESKKSVSGADIGIGLAIGLALGLVMCSVTDGLPVCLCLGVGIGLCCGTVFGVSGKGSAKQNDPVDPDDPDDEDLNEDTDAYN